MILLLYTALTGTVKCDLSGAGLLWRVQDVFSCMPGVLVGDGWKAGLPS